MYLIQVPSFVGESEVNRSIAEKVSVLKGLVNGDGGRRGDDVDPDEDAGYDGHHHTRDDLALRPGTRGADPQTASYNVLQRDATRVFSLKNCTILDKKYPYKCC